MTNGLARFFVQQELQPHALWIIVTAAEAMIFAWLGFADDGVSVGDFAFCHGCEATILTFDMAIGGRHSAFSHNETDGEQVAANQRESANHLFRF
jgi:hypothetical protein